MHFLSIPLAHAMGVVGSLPHPDGFSTPNALVGQACTVAQWIFAAAIIFSIIYVLLAAFTYMSSSGDPGKVKTATSRLLYVAIGLAVAFVAFFFPNMIAKVFDINDYAHVCTR